MNPRDYHSYRDLYEGVRSFLPSPDLLIYLTSSVDTLIARIRLRGRGFERHRRYQRSWPHRRGGGMAAS